MTEFDPIRAIREELQGLSEVSLSLRKMETQAEAKMGQAEIELNAVRKIKGYLQIEIERKRQVLEELENES